MKRILILSTADWDRPVWTNKQHLALRLSPHADVTYVNSLGLRRPKLSSRDDRARIIGKLRSVFPLISRDSAQRLDDSFPLKVVDPSVFPLHRISGPIAAFNSRRLRSAVSSWLDSPQQERVLWSFTPVTYGLDEFASLVVYHSVDFLGDFPGVNGQLIHQAETHLATRAHVALGSASPIVDHLRKSGFADVRLWENVADVELFKRHGRNADSRRDAVVFAGNFTGAKVRYDVLESLAQDGLGELHLAGPVGEGGGDTQAFTRLLRFPSVTYHGVLPPTELATLLGASKVGLIPYQLNEYTRGVFPMKVYEYLASGLAVVSTPLPSLRDVAHVSTDSDPRIIVKLVRDGIEQFSDNGVYARQRIADDHSWTSRTAEAIALLDGS
jgi:glycosyltransferase involved in cell wall biosynthesis